MENDATPPADWRAFWEQRYATEHTPWERGELHPAFRAWRSAEKLAPCRILIPGCGRSPEVLELARSGFEVTAVDLSPRALQALQANLRSAGLEAHCVEADLLAWAPQRPFDAVYDQTLQCALEPAAWPAYADRLAAWIRPGGHLFAIWMQRPDPGGPPWNVDPGRMQELLTADRWIWPAEPAEVHDHPGAPGLRELALILERRGS